MWLWIKLYKLKFLNNWECSKVRYNKIVMNYVKIEDIALNHNWIIINLDSLYISKESSKDLLYLIKSILLDSERKMKLVKKAFY